MSTIREKNPSKQISIVVECVVGNVRETIQHMVSDVYFCFFFLMSYPVYLN